MKNKKLFSIIGICLIVAIGLSFSAINIIKAVGPTTQTYNFYEGSIENFVALEGADEEMSLGGSNYNRLIDFSEGISVDGTTVIDGDGNFDGAVTGTTGTFSSTLGVTGISTLTGGINIGTTTPSDLEINLIGDLRVYPAGTATTTCDSASAGAMMYSTGTAKLLGCDGSTWNALW